MMTWWGCDYSTSKTLFCSPILYWKRSETPKRCETTTQVVLCVHSFLITSSPSSRRLTSCNFAPDRWAKHCDQRLFVCLSACLSFRSYAKISLNFL